ncbi:hypothetical protein UY416_25395 [Paenibacillus polymyxa]|uniref:hypothetical protein n=1 Tax=Paenibacillus polymyxa TaxID=1406 RepID=UPI002AB4CF94|nr:hypothetical protein [Paenibacillus polymyxa]MDY8049628.1 hypothetical protein [Paenibacillus polymyxa]
MRIDERKPNFSRTQAAWSSINEAGAHVKNCPSYRREPYPKCTVTPGCYVLAVATGANQALSEAVLAPVYLLSGDNRTGGGKVGCVIDT